MEPVIRTEGLTKRYGATVALDGLDLEVARAVVFGYLGPNGAGKTTTIRLLVGMLRPTAGRAQVLGLDTVADIDRLQARVGYLPGDFTAYGDLTGEQYLRFLANLRGGVDRTRVAALAERFELDLSRRIGALSHGNRQKVGIVQAFMHDPDLLVLDEPTAGLDPLMQREFVALVRETRDAGRTVFLSSHIMSEVEALADTVAILRQGRLVLVDDVAALTRRALRRLVLTFSATPPRRELEAADGVREVTVVGRDAHVVLEGSTASLLAVAAPHGVDNVVTHEADLEEIFLASYATAT